MTIGILGGSARTALTLIDEALSRGYKIFVLVRSPWKMLDYEKIITVIQGDATVSSNVAKLASQVDVLIDCVSVPLQHSKPTHIYSQVTQAIIDARPQSTARQHIVMSSCGTHHGRKLPRPANLAYEKLLGDVADDKEIAEEKLQKSSLPRTVIKCPVLTNGAKTEYICKGFDIYTPSLFDFIARKTVANCILDIAEKSLYIGEKVTPLVFKK